MSAHELSVYRLGAGSAEVALKGDHDQYSADRLARTLDGLFDEGYGVTVDLREATFVDSTTVATLIEAHRRAESSGLLFTVVLGESTGWAVRRLFQLTDLGSLLTVVSDR